MSAKDGYSVVLKLATTLVNGTTNQTLEEAWDEFEVTTKDSEQAKEWKTGEYSGSVNFEGVLDEVDAYTYSELRTAAALRAAIAFIYGDTAAGSVIYSGNCLITKLQQGAPKNGAIPFSCVLRITGFPTESTVAA